MKHRRRVEDIKLHGVITHLCVALSCRSKNSILARGLLLAVLCLFPLPTLAQSGGLYNRPPDEARVDSSLPRALREVGIDQRLNEQIPLDTVFRDETGREVRIGDYFNGGRPVLLALVYFDCPMMCIQVMGGITSSLKIVPFVPGRDFDVVLVSFDPRETPELAARNKERYLRRYGYPETAAGWHFLTGEQQSISRLADAVGFRYYFDETTEQFAHASGIMILTPDGHLARYFYGIEYSPRDVRLGLVEAAENRIGSPVDRILLYCYHYDPASGKYGATIMNIMRIGGILMIIGFAALYTVLRWWKPRAARNNAGETGGTA